MPAKKKQAVARSTTSPDHVAGLTPHANNPRKAWKDEQRTAFQESLREFGDLSGIVFNVRTGQLVGGHKRVDEFRDGNPQIAKEPVSGDSTGTVALGRVTVNGTTFSYREVDWPVEKEAAAMLAANKWSAEWDSAGVLNLAGLAEAGGFDLRLTGFAAAEFDSMLSPPDMTKPKTTKVEVARGTEQGIDDTGKKSATEAGFSKFEIILSIDNKDALLETLNRVREGEQLSSIEDALMHLTTLYED